jgi:hypothetical protein
MLDPRALIISFVVERKTILLYYDGVDIDVIAANTDLLFVGIKSGDKVSATGSRTNKRHCLH